MIKSVTYSDRMEQAVRDNLQPQTRAPGVRRAEIMRILRTHKAVTVEELCELLQVSAATIRRDLAALEQSDDLERSRGGIALPQLREAEQNFAQREEIDADEKRSIAARVGQLILPSQTVFMNDGTTVMAIARQIMESQLEVMIATPAVNVALALSESPTVTSCLLGGFMRQSSLATSGPFTEAMVAQVNADLAIIAPDGFHPQRGATFKNALDASLARKMAAQSQRVILVATKSKLMKVAQITGLEAAQIDVLVVGCTPDELPTALRDSGIEIIFA